MRRLKQCRINPDISKLKYNYYVFDTETTKLEPKPENFVFGIIYGYNFSKVIFSGEDFRTEFKKDRYRNKILFAHNAEFDLLTIFGNVYTEIDNQAIFNNKFISAKYENVTFADSMNIYPSSVAVIGEILGLEKIENEKVKGAGLTKENMTDKDIRYCKRDCKIVFLALLKMFENIGTIKITVSSLSMYLFRNKYLPTDISFSEMVDEFYQSYYGGRTEAFKIGKVSAKVFDINSMYPYVMVNCQFPDIRRLKKEVNVDVKYLLYMLDIYEGMAKVKIRHKQTYFGFIPVRMKLNGNEKLLFPVGDFETVVNFNELRFALQHDAIEILKVDYIVYANPVDSPFIDFINDTYKKRQQTDNALERTIYKLLMNALYGRFAMRMKMTTTYYEDLPFQIIQELQDTDKFYELSVFNQDRNDCYLITENEKMKNSFFSIPTFSSYITSEARIMLLKNLLANENNKVTYCDTDSIFLESDFCGDISDTLGSFKCEEKIITSISGLKNYTYINGEGKEIAVIKGISRNSIKISEGKYSIKKFYKTKGAIRQGKEPGKQYEQIKELKHKYDKRTVLNNGNTVPLEMPLPILLKNKLKRIISKNSRTYKVLHLSSPHNLNEAILCYFVSGRRIYTSDFLSITGFNTKDKEYKKYFWCYSENGIHLDTLYEDLDLSNYIEEKINFNDIENNVYDLLHKFPSRGLMLTELEKLFEIYKTNNIWKQKEIVDFHPAPF